MTSYPSALADLGKHGKYINEQKEILSLLSLRNVKIQCLILPGSNFNICGYIRKREMEGYTRTENTKRRT